MALTRLEYGRTWVSGSDFPTYEDSEQQVRADLQYHPDAVKDFLNETLFPQLEGTGGSGHIGDPRGGSLKAALDLVDETLEQHYQDIVDLSVGAPPEAVRAVRVDFTVEDWILPEAEDAGETTEGEDAGEAAETAEGETEDGGEDTGTEDTGDGGEGGTEEAVSQDATLRISQEAHGRRHGDFGYELRETVDGQGRSSSWNVRGTDVGWDEETGEVVLSAEEAYAGSIVFFGV